MITVDDRVGSAELAKHFRVRAMLGRLEFGDFAFVGKQEEDELIFIGVERKKIKDMVNSIINGRFSGHQLPGMLNAYQVSYLVVEGIWRVNPENDDLEIPRQGGWKPFTSGVTGAGFLKYLNSVDIITGVHVRQSGSVLGTVRMVEALHDWWDKSWNEHGSHLAIKKTLFPTVSLCKPSLLRRIASELPGIGIGKSASVAKEFDSVFDMVLADRDRWMKIPGIGKEIAERAIKRIRGE